MQYTQLAVNYIISVMNVYLFTLLYSDMIFSATNDLKYTKPNNTKCYKFLDHSSQSSRLLDVIFENAMNSNMISVHVFPLQDIRSCVTSMNAIVTI